VPAMKSRNFTKSVFDDSGFTTAWMLGLVLLILSVGGAFYDFSGALTQRQKLISISERASNAGATVLDEETLITSDGGTVILKWGGPGETAVDRCEDVIEEMIINPSPRTEITSYGCRQATGDPSVIVATVEGKVDYGIIASFTGKANQTFTVSSRARPSCSDGAC